MSSAATRPMSFCKKVFVGRFTETKYTKLQASSLPFFKKKELNTKKKNTCVDAYICSE